MSAYDVALTTTTAVLHDSPASLPSATAAGNPGGNVVSERPVKSR